MVYGEKHSFPPDIRVDKEVRVLAAAGHEVTICAFARPGLATEEQYGEGIRILRLVPQDRRRDLVHQLLTFRHLPWVRALCEYCKTQRPDVLHVHDLDLVPSTVKVGEKLGIAVVADLHENMPAAHVVYREQRTPIKKLASYVVYNYYWWRWHEARYLPRCALVLIVVPEAKTRLLKYGVPADRVVVVSNTEDETTFDMGEKPSGLPELPFMGSHWYQPSIKSVAGLTNV
jgi:hypothetical protein